MKILLKGRGMLGITTLVIIFVLSLFVVLFIFQGMMVYGFSLNISMTILLISGIFLLVVLSIPLKRFLVGEYPISVETLDKSIILEYKNRKRKNIKYSDIVRVWSSQPAVLIHAFKLYKNFNVTIAFSNNKVEMLEVENEEVAQKIANEINSKLTPNK